jgi:hypothetical protein
LLRVQLGRLARRYPEEGSVETIDVRQERASRAITGALVARVRVVELLTPAVGWNCGYRVSASGEQLPVVIQIHYATREAAPHPYDRDIGSEVLVHRHTPSRLFRVAPVACNSLLHEVYV